MAKKQIPLINKEDKIPAKSKLLFELESDKLSVNCDWDKSIDSEMYGKFLGLLTCGVLNGLIEDAVIAKGTEENAEDLAIVILDKFKGSLDEIHKFVDNNKPKERRKKKIINYEVIDLKNELDYEEEEPEIDEESNEMFQVNGFPGMMTKDTFHTMLETLRKRMVKFPDRETRMGFTNFSIEESIWEKIRMVEGIEYCQLIGRYTFIISLGRLFSFETVKKDIQKAVRNV
jgi:hypothetical protein